jgi:hypothetical protein
VIRRVCVVVAVLLSAAWVSEGRQGSVSRFEGTWVGLQTWTVDDNPSAREPQPVTLTLEERGGALTGSMAPFLGLRSGVAITEAEIVGDELHATASVARGRGWQGTFDVKFHFSNDADALTGTADVAFGEVPWLKFDYELSRKRSRY